MQATESASSHKRKRKSISGPGVEVVFDGATAYFVTTGDRRRVDKALFVPNVHGACFSSICTALRFIEDNTPGDLALCRDLKDAARRKFGQPLAEPSSAFALLEVNGGVVPYNMWVGDQDMFEALTHAKGTEASAYVTRKAARKSKKPKRDPAKPNKIVLDGSKAYILHPKGTYIEVDAIKGLATVTRAAKRLKREVGTHCNNGVLMIGACDFPESAEVSQRNPLAIALFNSLYKNIGCDNIEFCGPMLVVTLKRTTFAAPK